VLIEHSSNPTGDTFHGTSLCQGCGQDEETHDHHDRIAGETGKGLTGSQNAANNKRQHAPQGNELRLQQIKTEKHYSFTQQQAIKGSVGKNKKLFSGN